MAFETDQVPANVILVAAVAAHGEEAEDGHFAHQAEKVAILLTAQELVLLVITELIETPVVTIVRECRIEFGQSGARGVQIVAHRIGKGIVKKMDDTRFCCSGRIRRWNNSCCNCGEIAGCVCIQYAERGRDLLSATGRLKICSDSAGKKVPGFDVCS